MRTLRQPDVPPPTSAVQILFRLLLGAALLFAGTSHLTWARIEFQSQVPRWLPLPPDPVVVASGIVELVLGAALIVPGRYRTTVGWIVAALFVAVFPGNISQYTNQIDAFGLNTDLARALRLPVQPLLVAWALWATGAWQAWRASRRPAAM